MAPNTRKPKVMKSIEEVIGVVVVKRAIEITPIQAAKLIVRATTLSVETTQISQNKYDKLLNNYNTLLDEYNKMRTTAQEGPSVKSLHSPSSSSLELPSQDRETLSLRTS